MAYPLEVGGVEDYPIKVGSMLLTLVDPNRGYERAYNRWYERDHYYGGCMIGPFLYAGSRWVATRDLKSLRWPQAETVAKPYDAGSYVAIYFVEKGHHEEHFAGWARPQVNILYREGRGFAERRHVHTVLFDHIGAVYRDPDPVPVDIALDARYDGLVIAWLDARDGQTAQQLHAALADDELASLVKDSPIEIASSWTPSAGENDPKEVPMDLGSKAGGPERLCQLFFVRGNVADTLARLHAYTDAVAPKAEVRLVAPFLATVVGTDTYVDQLW
ncbi:MAG: hypothetical protein ACYDH6_01830 [Acidimicrobiales bacterium]